MMRKTPMKRTAMKRRRGKSKNRMPTDVVETVKDRSQGMCEAAVSETCTGAGEQLHHRQLRSQGGQHTVPNLIDVCAPCHSRFHREVAEAQEFGWIVKSTHDPAMVGVEYRGTTVILTDTGSVEVKA